MAEEEVLEEGEVSEDTESSDEKLWGQEEEEVEGETEETEGTPEEEPEEVDPREEFGAGIEGDETGRNMAYNSFKKVESSIIDSYELLSNPDDQELFYDYLIANIKLYFDKFEDELSGDIEEPTNQAYEDAKAEKEPKDLDTGGIEELFEINLD